MWAMLRQAGWIFFLAAIPAAVSGLGQLSVQRVEKLAPGEVRAGTVREWGEAVQWVDARSRGKYQQGHIAGAILLNEDEWGELVGPFLDAWDADKHLVIYCDGGTCEASQRVAERIRGDLKIGGVSVLKGGISAWKRR